MGKFLTGLFSAVVSVLQQLVLEAKFALKQELVNVKFAIARFEVLRVVTGLTSFAI